MLLFTRICLKDLFPLNSACLAANIATWIYPASTFQKICGARESVRRFFRPPKNGQRKKVQENSTFPHIRPLKARPFTGKWDASKHSSIIQNTLRQNHTTASWSARCNVAQYYTLFPIPMYYHFIYYILVFISKYRNSVHLFSTPSK